MTTTVSAGQNLFDVALQELGSREGAYALAAANGLAVTDPLTPGQVLALPAVVATDVAGYFAARGQRINTGEQLLPTPPARVIRDHHELDYDTRDFA
ncbi:hypothetical protein LJ737_19955 [Hymenobacter sp. 15J16-1T3B]|uniref:LysM peptidoglycan-binding domain-containing protein n=1 Tax=Hymenobacter sp. 15J16-1T3B TaxID=2886941 RepID=UPI001D0F61C5|nr:LysM domain-containing protein [Hymenobacter sp. 15J16-1T3B]MCC3159527.1 hypothetical protein [Hymenobacter sp. 15J16-1T3B]